MTDPHPLGAAALSPCPFCGGEDLRISCGVVMPDNYHNGHVYCADCDAQGAAALSLDGWLSTEDEARAAAITAWNRRPTAPSQEGEKRVIDDATGSTVPGPFCSGVVAEMRLNHVTAALVNGFMIELAWKLAKAEVKYGYTDGWAQDGWEDECRRQLHHHAAKGDPLDVAAYAAFCWRHGWSTAHPAKPVDGEVEQLNRLVERLTREAEQWAQEARTQKSSLHEAYRAVTNGTGEPGDWNGAQPIINELNRLRDLAAAAATTQGTTPPLSADNEEAVKP